MTIRAVTVLLAIAAIACSVACGQQGTQAPETAQTQSNPVTEEKPSAEAGDDGRPVVVFLGDSLTAGLGVAEDRAFPAVTAAMLEQDGMAIRMINAGVSGDTTAGGLRRLPWVLRSRPEVLVVGLGANDGLRGFPVDVTRANLGELIVQARAAGAEVLLLAMEVPPSHGPDYAASFRGIYTGLSEELDVTLVPGFLVGVGGVPEMNQADGIHPTEEGHRRLAANIAPYLNDALRD
jgi:acyl-CoA thioesterase-1